MPGQAVGGAQAARARLRAVAASIQAFPGLSLAASSVADGESRIGWQTPVAASARRRKRNRVRDRIRRMDMTSRRDNVVHGEHQSVLIKAQRRGSRAAGVARRGGRPRLPSARRRDRGAASSDRPERSRRAREIVRGWMYEGESSARRNVPAPRGGGSLREVRRCACSMPRSLVARGCLAGRKLHPVEEPEAFAGRTTAARPAPPTRPTGGGASASERARPPAARQAGAVGVSKSESSGSSARTASAP